MTPRYQKHTRNATSRPVILIVLCTLLIALSAFRTANAAPRLQADGASSRPLYLIPETTNGVTLQTHVADFQISDAADGQLQVGLDALYRLRNLNDVPATVSLRIAPAAGDVDVEQVEGLTLTAAGQPVALTTTADGALSAQVQVPADSSLDLTLAYAMPLAGGAAPALVYSPGALAAWPGSISLRVQLLPPPTVTSDSLLQVAPEGWSYAPSADAQRPYIRWLYDGRLPREPFVFQFVAPAFWANLQAAAREAVPGAPAAAFLRLAGLIAQLDQSISREDTAVRDRLYAQALAAYQAGIDSLGSGGTPADQIASLHQGLAALYRGRIIGADGKLDAAYAELMVEETGAAQLVLPPEAPQRAELVQWQAEGLRALLNAARRQQDWPGALALFDRLAALPASVVDPAVLERERRALLVQQALQLLERGQRDEATALAGAVMGDVDLMPPANAQSLFASWHISVTADPQQTVISLLGIPAATQPVTAQQALDQVLAAWQSLEPDQRRDYAFARETPVPSADEGAAFRLQVTLPPAANGLPLANALPERVDWSLLRAVLLQVGPAVERKGHWLGQEIALSQSLDLRTAGERWKAMAADLEHLAGQFEAEAAAGDEETALRARIQAINYHQAAQQWRSLASDSWLRTTFVASGSSPLTALSAPPARAWLTTVDTPPQVQRLQARTVEGSRVLSLLIIVLVGVSASTGLLWWLL